MSDALAEIKIDSHFSSSRTKALIAPPPLFSDEDALMSEEEVEKFEAIKAKTRLEKFLQDNKKAISHLEGARQQISKRGSNMDDGTLDFLEENIREESSGALSLSQGGICEIGRDYWLGDHARTDEQKAALPPFSQQSAIKGFEFRFYPPKNMYHCVVLGMGGERTFYNNLSPEEKTEFLKPHIAKSEAAIDDFGVANETTPFRHTALLEYDNKSDSYNVLQFYAHTEDMGEPVQQAA